MKSDEIAVRRPERDDVDTLPEDPLHELGREAAGKVEAIDPTRSSVRACAVARRGRPVARRRAG
jgi:hypothetical protein